MFKVLCFVGHLQHLQLHAHDSTFEKRKFEFATKISSHIPRVKPYSTGSNFRRGTEILDQQSYSSCWWFCVFLDFMLIEQRQSRWYRPVKYRILTKMIFHSFDGFSGVWDMILRWDYWAPWHTQNTSWYGWKIVERGVQLSTCTPRRITCAAEILFAEWGSRVVQWWWVSEQDPIWDIVGQGLFCIRCLLLSTSGFFPSRHNCNTVVRTANRSKSSYSVQKQHMLRRKHSGNDTSIKWIENCSYWQ